MKNIYKEFKKILKENENNNIFLSNLSLIESIMFSMFTYKNLPDNVYSEYIEKCFSRYGACAFSKLKNGNFFTNYPIFSDGLDDYGIGTHAHIISVNSESDVGFVNKDIAVGWNNSLHKPDFDILKYVSQLSEVDISLKSVVINSRLAPVYRASDGKESESIKEVLNSIYSGKPQVIVNKNTFSELINENEEKKIINFTFPDEVEKLNYLSKYRDDIISCFAQTYGFNMQSTGKMAQQTMFELSGYEAFSKVIPSDRLKCRKDFCKNINEIFGLDISVDFSDVWKQDFMEFIERRDNNETERLDDSLQE